jgi:cholesterol transport system auxiliary component
MKYTWLLMGMVIVPLAGCGPLVARPQPPALHDLGGGRASLAVGLALRDIEVAAPSWLEGTAMYYRLAYRSATRLDFYGGSRWSAPPVEMLSVALRRMLEPAGPVSACALQVQVDEFVQSFDQPDSARALIGGRASLVDTRARRVLARLPFSISEPGAGADAAGGAAAFSRGVDALGGRLADWLNSPELKALRDDC